MAKPNASRSCPDASSSHPHSSAYPLALCTLPTRNGCSLSVQKGKVYSKFLHSVNQLCLRHVSVLHPSSSCLIMKLWYFPLGTPFGTGSSQIVLRHFISCLATHDEISDPTDLDMVWQNQVPDRNEKKHPRDDCFISAPPFDVICDRISWSPF